MGDAWDHNFDNWGDDGPDAYDAYAVPSPRSCKVSYDEILHETEKAILFQIGDEGSPPQSNVLEREIRKLQFALYKCRGIASAMQLTPTREWPRCFSLICSAVDDAVGSDMDGILAGQADWRDPAAWGKPTDNELQKLKEL